MLIKDGVRNSPDRRFIDELSLSLGQDSIRYEKLADSEFEITAERVEDIEKILEALATQKGPQFEIVSDVTLNNVDGRENLVITLYSMGNRQRLYLKVDLKGDRSILPIRFREFEIELEEPFLIREQ